MNATVKIRELGKDPEHIRKALRVYLIETEDQRFTGMVGYLSKRDCWKLYMAHDVTDKSEWPVRLSKDSPEFERVASILLEGPLA